MLDNKKIRSLAEDFADLGLIRKPIVEEKEAKKETISRTERKKILESRKEKALAKKKKALLFARKKKIEESRRINALKEKRETIKSTRKQSRRSVIENLVDIEKRLKTDTSIHEMLKAFENVSKVSSLAIKKFKRLSEQDADQIGGRDAADYNGGKEKSSKKEVGKDKLDMSDKEGNVGYDSDDEQEGSVKSTKAVADVTGKYAGKDRTVDLANADIIEMDEFDTEFDTEEEEKKKCSEVDDMELDDMELDDIDIMKADDEELDDEELDDMKMDDSEELDDMEMDDSELDDSELDDSEVDDMEVDDSELGDMEIELDDESDDDVDPPMDDLEMDSDDDMEMDDEILDDEEELGDEEILDDEEEEDFAVESKISKKHYIAELTDIKKEAADVMAKIRKHAISPQDAEGLLKDILMRLSGAVGDLGSMMQDIGASSEETAV